MFGLRGTLKEVLVIVTQVRDYVEGDDRAVRMLERRVEALEEQNKQLFDRLMARDWEAYATMKDGSSEELTQRVPRLTDDLAGDFAEIEDAEHEA